MADRVSASITLGGTVNPSSDAELATIIADEGLSIEWDGEPFDPSHRIEGEPLRLFAHEVACGRFETLETWCVANGVPFTRWSGGYGSEWSPERVVFPGAGEPQSYQADENDRIVVDRNDVTRLGSIAALIEYFDAADLAVPPLAVTGSADSA